MQRNTPRPNQNMHRWSADSVIPKMVPTNAQQPTGTSVNNPTLVNTPRTYRTRQAISISRCKAPAASELQRAQIPTASCSSYMTQTSAKAAPAQLPHMPCKLQRLLLLTLPCWPH